MSEQERIQIYKKVAVGSLSAWIDLELNDVDDAKCALAFKSFIRQWRDAKDSDEVWDLLRRAAREKDISLEEVDRIKGKIKEIMQSGTADYFGLSIEELDDLQSVDKAVFFFKRANDDLKGLGDKFREEIQGHINFRKENPTLK